jgi:DNA-binding HxlR family transcriptional regulator
LTSADFKCGLEAVLAILGGKWKPLIVYHLASGSKRTGQLRRLVTNVSEKMLIQHLKELTDDGVIRRVDFQTVPPHVEYELTSFGQGLSQVLAPLCAWGTQHSAEVVTIVESANASRRCPRRMRRRPALPR